MSLSDFIKQYTGVETGNTSENMGECVGLVMKWLELTNNPHIWGHARDLVDNAPTVYYDRIYNSPDNYPLPGDGIVWGNSWGGGFGHTGVVVTADKNQFTSFEQNNPTGSLPHLVDHADYTGVIGWVHPRNIATEQANNTDNSDCQSILTTAKSKITELEAERDRLNGVIEQKDITLANLNQTIAEKNSTIATLTTKCDSIAEQLILCQDKYGTCSSQALKVPELESNSQMLKDQIAGFSQKETNYVRQINTLNTRISKLKSPIKSLLVDIYEAIVKK